MMSWKYISIVILAIFIACPTPIRDLSSEYACIKLKYPKLKQEWFLIIQTECSKYNIEPADICAVIEHEGMWIPNITHKNYDASGRVISVDFGLMQINSCHSPSNPEIFLDPKINIAKGVYEYHLCLLKANDDKPTANRMYNAGRNNVAKNYKNWPYVYRIAAHRYSLNQIQQEFYRIK